MAARNPTQLAILELARLHFPPQSIQKRSTCQQAIEESVFILVGRDHRVRVRIRERRLVLHAGPGCARRRGNPVQRIVVRKARGHRVQIRSRRQLAAANAHIPARIGTGRVVRRLRETAILRRARLGHRLADLSYEPVVRGTVRQRGSAAQPIIGFHRVARDIEIRSEVDRLSAAEILARRRQVPAPQCETRSVSRKLVHDSRIVLYRSSVIQVVRAAVDVDAGVIDLRGGRQVADVIVGTDQAQRKIGIRTRLVVPGAEFLVRASLVTAKSPCGDNGQRSAAALRLGGVCLRER